MVASHLAKHQATTAAKSSPVLPYESPHHPDRELLTSNRYLQQLQHQRMAPVVVAAAGQAPPPRPPPCSPPPMPPSKRCPSSNRPLPYSPRRRPVVEQWAQQPQQQEEEPALSPRSWTRAWIHRRGCCRPRRHGVGFCLREKSRGGGVSFG